MLGLSYLLSIVTVFVKDIQYVWNVLVHILFFISPIFWSFDNVGGILVDVQKINPLGQLIEIGHKLVIDSQIPPLNDWLYTTTFILSIFFVGYFIFHKFENRIAEEM